MPLFFALLVIASKPIPVINAVVTMPRMGIVQPPTLSATVNQTFSSAPLVENGDNTATMQAFFDSLPTGVTAQIPAGSWQLHGTLRLNKTVTLEGPQSGTVELVGVRADVDAHTMDIGNYGTDVKVNDVVLRRITFSATGLTGSGVHNCVWAFGDRTRFEDCIFKDSHHEGVTGGGVNVSCLRCKAINCGNGSAWYGPRSTAGFNLHVTNDATAVTYTDCEAIDCGQGYEIDAYGSKAIRCVARMTHAPVASPAIGFNVGSAGIGIWNITIQYCKTIGYSSAVETGNGIGTLANISIVDNVFDDGGVSFMGGIQTNAAPGAIPPGVNPPDTGQSHVDRNVFITRSETGASAAYSTTPAASGSVYGREPCTFNDNVFLNLYAGSNPFVPALLNIAGNVTAPVEWKRNKLIGFDDVPARGDGATFTYNQNPAVPGQPNLTTEFNLVFKRDGSQRAFVERREGATP